MSGVAGASLLAAACGHSGPKISTLPSPAREADVALLNELLDVEHFVKTAYIAAVPLLTDHNQRLGIRFLDQEVAHIHDLELIVFAAGGTPPDEKPSYDLGLPRTQTELLELLRRAENQAIDAYLSAIPRFTSAEARQTAMSILAVEAQHVSLIRRNLGLRQVPSALVRGGQ